MASTIQQYSGPLYKKKSSRQLLNMLIDDDIYPHDYIAELDDLDTIEHDFSRKFEINILKDMPLPNCRSILMCVGFPDFRTINRKEEIYLQKKVEDICKSYVGTYDANEISFKAEGLCNNTLWRSCALVVRKSELESIQNIVSSMGGVFLQYLASFLINREGFPYSRGFPYQVMYFYITFQNTWCALDFIVGYTQCEFGCSPSNGFIAHKCAWSPSHERGIENQRPATAWDQVEPMFGEYFFERNLEDELWNRTRDWHGRDDPGMIRPGQRWSWRHFRGQLGLLFD